MPVLLVPPICKKKHVKRAAYSNPDVICKGVGISDTEVALDDQPNYRNSPSTIDEIALPIRGGCQNLGCGRYSCGLHPRHRGHVMRFCFSNRTTIDSHGASR